MRRIHRMSQRFGALCAALIITACSDRALVSAPPADRSLPPALAAKQSSTSGRILYFSGAPAQVYSMDDDGNNVLQLTSAPGIGLDPAWAPDGKRVLYVNDGGFGPLAIYVMNADGTARTRLTDPGPSEVDEDPHAIGKRIVFTRTGATGRALWVMNDDGSDVTRLTDGSLDFNPAPSPSGKQVAFVRYGDIHVLDLETGVLTNVSGTIGSLETTPAWSPNGKQIAFARRVTTGQPDIYVMDVDGTNVTQLTLTPNEIESTPRWSPDGKRIAFTATYGLRIGTWVMFADGTGLNDLTRTHTPYADEFLGAWAR
jgi:TolB protein